MGFWKRLLRGPKRPAPWLAGLSEEQRRVLAENLRRLVETKGEIDRAIKKGAPRR